MKRKTKLLLAPAAMLSVLALAACGGADAGADTGTVTVATAAPAAA